MKIIAPVLFIALLLGAWELAVRALYVPAYFLPGPVAIGQAMAQNAPLLVGSAWITLRSQVK